MDRAVEKKITEASPQKRGWPYVNNDCRPLPAAIAHGSPWPRISIVTPSYNQAAFLEETILSVANQGYPNVEHIIVDGASTDETLNVLNRYSSLLSYWVSEPDRGQSHAINKGMKHATGDILTWLNSDDRLAPGSLAAIALAFHYSKADLIAGVAELYKDGEQVGRHITACDDGPLPLEDLLDLDRCWFPGQFFYQPEVMFTREIWERAGAGLDEALTYSLDYELWVRFAESSARLHVIGHPVAQFRFHALQKTHVEAGFSTELKKLNKQILTRLKKSVPGQVPKPRRLRVAMLNDIGFHYGAGTAHKRLAQALALGGADVSALSFQEGLAGRGMIDVAAVIANLEGLDPDIVLLGNLHGAKVAPGLVGDIAERWPTLCVLHDFWLLTGRCAYTNGCQKLVTGCDATCPTPHEYPALARTKIRKAWETKRRILKRRVIDGRNRPILLANSSSTQSLARQALGERSSAARGVQRITLGIPTQTFVPLDKSTARHLLGIDKNAFVLFVAATDVGDPRKGGDLIADAVSRVKIPKLVVLAAGWMDPRQPSRIPNLRAMGYIDDPSKMALLYSASNLVIGASREETLGQVFVEASACGTPVVAIKTSGVVDSVWNGVSGILVSSFSAEKLAETIESLYLDVETTERMAVLGRYFVENEFSLAKARQSLIAMLIRVGLFDRLHLPRKGSIGLQVPDVACNLIGLRVNAARPGWLARWLMFLRVICSNSETLWSGEPPPGPLFRVGRRFIRLVYRRGRPGWVRSFAKIVLFGDVFFEPLDTAAAKTKKTVLSLSHRVRSANRASQARTRKQPRRGISNRNQKQ
jgi:glycosyltransferase involved in cell wall biosynthesis